MIDNFPWQLLVLLAAMVYWLWVFTRPALRWNPYLPGAIRRGDRIRVHYVLTSEVTDLNGDHLGDVKHRATISGVVYDVDPVTDTVVFDDLRTIPLDSVRDGVVERWARR